MQNPKVIGECATCCRLVRLTKHHLIPKKTHARLKKQALTSQGELDEIILVCRTCHDGIHTFYDESTLATSYNTLEKLLNDEKLSRHFKWVSKLKKGLA